MNSIGIDRSIYNCRQVFEATAWALERMGVDLGDKLIDIYLVDKEYCQADSAAGFKYAEAGVHYDRKRFHIIFNRAICKRKINIRTLMHELRHVQQVTSGNMTRSYRHVRTYRGKRYDARKLRWALRPWERDAVRWELKLWREWKALN